MTILYRDLDHSGSISIQEADLEDRPGDRRLLNRLGVLYAQYGLRQKARERFAAIVEAEDSIPALLNFGQIAYLDEG